MPTYVYKFVDTNETIEVQQAFTDESLTEYAHPESGVILPIKKIFQPVGVTFKGSGFFKTDNRDSKATTPPGSSSDSPSGVSTDAGSSGSDSSDSSSGTASTTSESKGSSTSTSTPSKSAPSSTGSSPKSTSTSD
ncbi:FmdB family transcriptional regulator [bacterium]|nr:FmdB family transcriptional regulator [bacterium]